MGVASGKPSLLAEAKAYVKQKYGKPGNVYLGIVSRLDAPVTGVVLIARTSKAARRLSSQFRDRQVEKLYWALVESPCRLAAGRWEDWIRKDERHRKVVLADAQTEGAQHAALTLKRVRHNSQAQLLEISLETGRKHQIRVQLAGRKWPVLGDRKYGSRIPFPDGIALHARRIQFTHPVRKEPIDLTAPLPTSWRPFGLT